MIVFPVTAVAPSSNINIANDREALPATRVTLIKSVFRKELGGGAPPYSVGDTPSYGSSTIEPTL